MNSPPLALSSEPSPNRTLRDLDLGCRIGFLVLTILLTYVAIRLSWSFSSELIHAIINGMLKGSPLPLSVQVAQAGKTELVFLSCGLPFVATIAAVTIRRPFVALLIISGCNLILGAITLFLLTVLWDTLGKIVGALS